MIGKPYSARKGYFVQRSSVPALNQTSDDLEKMNMTHYLAEGGKGKTGNTGMHACVWEVYKNSFMEEVR